MYGMFGFSGLCIVLSNQGVEVVLILAVAEVAHHLTVGVLVPHTHKLCTAKTEQHLLGALGAAIALVLHRALDRKSVV